MENVFLVFTSDVWHTIASKEAIAVATTKPKAIKLIKEYCEKHRHIFLEYDEETLNSINQTQGDTESDRDIEFIIEEMTLNTL